MPPRALIVRHVAFEDLAGFAPALSSRGFELRYFDIGLGELTANAATDFDLAIILGGPIGVYEEDRYPFLLDELKFIEARIAAGKPTMGICLGAQLMAKALGARVYPGPAKEIGFAPLEVTPEGLASCVGTFAGCEVLHWHGDVFDLPDGARRLASTQVCPNQAFSYGESAIGFQFHPEYDGVGFERWLIGHTFELATNSVDVRALREQANSRAPDLKALAAACMSQWLDGLTRPAPC